MEKKYNTSALDSLFITINRMNQTQQLEKFKDSFIHLSGVNYAAINLQLEVN